MTDEFAPKHPYIETRTPVFYQYLREKKGYTDEEVEKERENLGYVTTLGIITTRESFFRHQIRSLLGFLSQNYNWKPETYKEVKRDVLVLKDSFDWFVYEGEVSKEVLEKLLDELEKADWNKDTVAGLYQRAQVVLAKPL